MSEENDAKRLAAWLENPGSDPPPDLDPEVAGVIFTLSPRRAPAPRVRLDDILAGVQEGPFAAPAPRKDQIRTLATPPEKVATARPPSRRWPRWTIPAATIGAALAALAIIFPSSLNLQKNAQEPILAPMPEMAATAPARPSKTTDTASPAVPEAKAPTATAVVPATPAMAPTITSAKAPAPPPPPPPSMASGAAVADNDRAKADVSQGAIPAEFAASEAQKTTADMPQAEPASAPAMDEYQAVREEEGAEMDDMVIAEAASKSKKESERSLRPPAPAAPAAARAPTAASDSNATVVWPLDYSANWYSSYADIVPAYTAALSLEQQGQWAQAAVAWRALMRDARSNVAQDAAFRCANAWWQDGQVATALSVVDEGLRRSSANTAFRARLFALKAQLLDTQGRGKEAEAARKEAIQLNLGR